jgi:hypothetical protein
MRVEALTHGVVNVVQWVFVCALSLSTHHQVALFDFVKPSTQGSTWGLGGTCVNVGCVCVCVRVRVL